jgi:hypothetical protein
MTVTTYQQWIENYKTRTANQPTRKVTNDEIVKLLRAGKDADGGKVIDKWFSGTVGTVTVELPDGQWRTYRMI